MWAFGMDKLLEQTTVRLKGGSSVSSWEAVWGNLSGLRKEKHSDLSWESLRAVMTVGRWEAESERMKGQLMG